VKVHEITAVPVPTVAIMEPSAAVVMVPAMAIDTKKNRIVTGLYITL
jgi:hypothetical protein